MKKVIYIAGPITGVERYWEAFEKAEDRVESLGYIALTPSRLPLGMSEAQYMRICFAMIDSADAVLFLDGWVDSRGAKLEREYCNYICKPVARLECRAFPSGDPYPEETILARLDCQLKEVLRK